MYDDHDPDAPIPFDTDIDDDDDLATCDKCGAEISALGDYCPKCGHWQTVAGVVGNSTSAAPTATPSS